jgi:hypothetical protein
MANPPAAGNVKLLCHFDGTNGQTTTVDSSTYARTLSRASGNPTLSSTQSKFGGTSSVSSTATNVRWQAPNSTDFDFGSGQFTIEGWVYFTSAPTSVHALTAHWHGTGDLAFFFGHVSGSLAFYYSTTGSDNPSVGAAWTPALNTWYHIAADRDASNVLRVYLNGVVHASATVSATLHVPNPLYTLDIAGSDTWGGIAGYVDDIRIVKGEAVYGGAFTPPSAALPDPTITHARVSQLAAEVIRTNTAVKARVSQVAAEVLRINTGTVIRTSQVAVEVLRPNEAAVNGRPVVMVCT